jgi:CBS domain-containing protein
MNEKTGYTCAPEESVRAALERMSEARVRRLPVMTVDGDLQGLLSIDDIILWEYGRVA